MVNEWVGRNSCVPLRMYDKIIYYKCPHTALGIN